MIYRFRYRRRLFFRTVSVIGHTYDKEMDRLSLLLNDGGVKEIAKWSSCDCELGTDWVLAKKKDMEIAAGQPVTINRDLDAK